MNLKRNLPKNVLDKSWPTPPPSLCEVGMSPGMWEGNPGLEDYNTISSWASHPFLNFNFSLNKFSSLCCCYYSVSAWIGLSAQNKILQKSQLPYPKNSLDWRYSWKEGRAQQCRGGTLVFIPHSKGSWRSPGQTLIEKGKKSTTNYLILGQETAF